MDTIYVDPTPSVYVKLIKNKWQGKALKQIMTTKIQDH
jgi:hypothetical protein